VIVGNSGIEAAIDLAVNVEHYRSWFGEHIRRCRIGEKSPTLPTSQSQKPNDNRINRWCHNGLRPKILQTANDESHLVYVAGTSSNRLVPKQRVLKRHVELTNRGENRHQTLTENPITQCCLPAVCTTTRPYKQYHHLHAVVCNPQPLALWYFVP